MQPVPSDPAVRSVLFELSVEAEPGALPRLLAVFARRGLCPDTVRARRAGDTLSVALGAEAMPREMLPLVEGNLRQLVGARLLATVLRGPGAVAPALCAA